MASGKGNNNAIGFLQLIFQGTISASYATLALNATSGPATNLYVSLHNANPGATGGQTTSETAYTNYARVAVPRAITTGWTASGELIENAIAITFPACGVTGDTLTYVGIGLSAFPTNGVLLYFGQLTSPLIISNGITPSIAINALTITES